MNTIKLVELQVLVGRINQMLGTPAAPYIKINDKYVAQIGCYHLDQAYGKVALHQIASDTGGVYDILGGHQPKRDMYHHLQAFISGIEANQRKVQS